MLKFINGMVDRLFAVAGGLALSQAPLFMLQYTQRLAGHVQELQLQVAMMRQAASLTGKSLEQYVGKFLASQDPDFLSQGILMQKMTVRADLMARQLHALQEATPLSRPFIFLSHINWEIARPTLKAFEPGLSFTLETGLYMVVGIALGYASYSLVRLGLRRMGRLLPFRQVDS
jgi:hypothetical protein